MRRHHRLTAVAGTLLVTATLAPAALAEQDLRSPDARDAAATRVQDLRSPDAVDAATARHAAPVVVRSEPLAADGTPWNWESAAVGALASSGLLVALAGGGVLVTRRRVTAA